MSIHIKANYDSKFRGLIVIALNMVRVELGGGSPSKITLYILKNNCTKFGAFVRLVPISSKFTTKQPDSIYRLSGARDSYKGEDYQCSNTRTLDAHLTHYLMPFAA